MIEIPQRFRMDNLVKLGNINKKIIKSLVCILVKFHNNAPTNNKISKFALPQLVKKKLMRISKHFPNLEKLIRSMNLN